MFYDPFNKISLASRQLIRFSFKILFNSEKENHIYSKTIEAEKLYCDSDSYCNLFYLFSNYFFNRMSPALLAVINQIHIRLGTNNDLVKQFIKYRRLSGHPAPFRCEREADLCLTFSNYLKALDIHNCTTYMSVQPKVKAVTEDGVVLSQLLLFCLFESRNLKSENEGIIFTYLALNLIIKPFNIITSHIAAVFFFLNSTF